MAFTSEVLAQRTSNGERRTVKEQGMMSHCVYDYGYVLIPHTPHTEYRCHVYVRSDGLACVTIADDDYPPRVVFTLMSKVNCTPACGPTHFKNAS